MDGGGLCRQGKPQLAFMAPHSLGHGYAANHARRFSSRNRTVGRVDFYRSTFLNGARKERDGRTATGAIRDGVKLHKNFSCRSRP
jgi:hypothetical protein